ncbi:MAG TPA: hypothetical protein H9839_02250 [Candidatus Intestinimonas stercorigallinarum]|nr:hypothetical protein [Candidatus Intestinimonas stercorigallinarum]
MKQLCLQKAFWKKRGETTQRIPSERGIHRAFALLYAHFRLTTVDLTAIPTI